jgi:hypothetical protein
MTADRLLFLDYTSPDARLVTSDLSGNSSVVTTSAGNKRTIGSPDFDGRRAAWIEHECGIASVMIEPDVTRVPAATRAASPCVPPRIADLRRASGGRFVARLLCEKGCRGELDLYDLTAGRPRSKLASRTIDLRSSPVARNVGLAPSATIRRRLAKRPALRVQAIFSGRDGRGRQVADTLAGSLKGP